MLRISGYGNLGLGFYIVYFIVKNYGGSIMVDNKEMGGLLFKIVFLMGKK